MSTHHIGATGSESPEYVREMEQATQRLTDALVDMLRAADCGGTPQHVQASAVLTLAAVVLASLRPELRDDAIEKMRTCANERARDGDALSRFMAAVMTPGGNA